MKTTGWIGIVTGMCVALGCEQAERLSVDVKAKAVYESLQLYPVRANKVFLERRQALGALLTLEEAVKSGKVIVTERDSAGTEDVAQVNRLFIENTSSDSVLILSGEVVIGGNQNRMIAKDVLLPPHSGKLDVDVFCVEHGRWSGESGEFEVALEMMAPPKIRPFADAETTQQDVWSKVSVHLDAIGQPSETGALYENHRDKRHVDNPYMDSVKLYIDGLSLTFTHDADIIGVIAVDGDSIIACDLFATPGLFKKHFPKLLNSYAHEAAYGKHASLISPARVEDYLEALLKDSKRSGEFVAKKGAALRKPAAHLGTL